uniref:Iodothyronine deiodinase n=3 Tax=Callorhinchus milii TaxID=7868 RepID=A0A4W3J864_CALMI
MVERYAEVADFLLVYVDEAHPSDGWALRSRFQLRRHRSQEERCSAAGLLAREFGLPAACGVVADLMDNNANRAYGVAFERLCVVQSQKIAYLGGKGPFFYNLNGVREWLERHSGQRWG